MLIDLHCHTFPASDDSYLTPAELINQAKKVGLEALCLTEHDWFWEAEELARLSWIYDLLLLPGVEITTEEGHLLVFGLDRYIFGMHRASFVRQMVDEIGGVIIVAHPFRRHVYPGLVAGSPEFYTRIERASQNPIFQLADAMEVLNGKASEMENGFALSLSRRLGMSGTGGGDAHAFPHVGICATLFQRKISNIQELITEIKEGRFRPANMGRRSEINGMGHFAPG